MRTWSDSEEKVKKSIQDELKARDYPDWVNRDFRYIVEYPDIIKRLDDALEQTTKRHMNKHGVEHGLKVAWNALQLFELIRKDFITSDFLKAPRALPHKPGVLFCILVASYIHDIGRFFDPVINHEEQTAMAVEIIKALAQPSPPLKPFILKREECPKMDIAVVSDRIKELCLCHDKKEEASDKVEIALIKLADCLDCDESRVYEIGELIEHNERMKEVFFEDKSPEKYFGNLNVEGVKIQCNEREGKAEVIFNIKNYSASIPIKTALTVLEKCKQSGDSVKQLAHKVRLIITEKEDEGHTYTLYPKEEAKTPGGRLLSNFYKFDIQNENGNTSIEQIFTLKNEKDLAGMLSHPLRLGGWEKIAWENLCIHMYNSKTNKELAISYKGSKDGGITHAWVVLFEEKLTIEQEPLEIKGGYLWNKFFRVENDEFTYVANTPGDKNQAIILFPKGEIKADEIEAYVEIADSPGPLGVIVRNKINTTYNEEGRVELNYVFTPLKENYIYRIRWARQKTR